MRDPILNSGSRESGGPANAPVALANTARTTAGAVLFLNMTSS
jgi:hypothetical protein